MSHTQPITYVRIAEVLTGLKMITEEKARSALEEAATYATEPIAPGHEVAAALESFGVAVPIHADDVDFADDHYEWLLGEAADVTGGNVTVTNYRFERRDEDDEDSGPGVMHFESNGTPLSFQVEQESNDYLDMGAAQAAIEALSPHDDPRDFRRVDHGSTDPLGTHDDIMVLATAEQREGLQHHLGIKFALPLH
ncbi:hypothetical protein [Streptomyces sp. NPDC093589]|uniref:hypothetical protein n=1 Tax=Streptomyces sp. NPDC093589 TaxID=3366043 RepID=UPI0038250BC6